MQNTRQHIMDYLGTNRMASAVEIGRVFRMTAANVRHHLGVLEAQGLVETVGVGESNEKRRGHPTKLYMATKTAQSHSLDHLASALLEQVTGQRESKQRERGLRRAAERLQGRAGQESGTITQRLVVAAGRLNKLNYKAHWEAHARGPRVILGQCPYAAIIEEHPELCQMDAYLLEGMLGEEVEQRVKITREVGGAGACVFVVRRKSQT